MAELTDILANLDWNASGAVPNEDLAAALGLLTNPGVVLAKLTDFLAQNVLTFQIFKGRTPSPSGAAAIQPGIALKATAIDGDSPYAPMTPGAALPRVNTGETEPVMYQTVQVGAQAVVTLPNMIARRRNAVDVALQQLANLYSDTVDAASVAALSAAIPSTGGSARVVAASTTALAATSTSQVFGPITDACAVIDDARQGLEGKLVICTNYNASQLSSNGPTAIIQALSGDRDSTMYKGYLGKVAGLDIVSFPSSLAVGTPFANMALVVDNDMLGGLAEQIPYRAKTAWHDADWSDGTSESFVVSILHNFVNYVQFANAGVWVSGLFQ